MINTDYINEDHIEAAKVYIRTLADSEKFRRKTVVHMTELVGKHVHLICLKPSFRKNGCMAV